MGSSAAAAALRRSSGSVGAYEIGGAGTQPGVRGNPPRGNAPRIAGSVEPLVHRPHLGEYVAALGVELECGVEVAAAGGKTDEPRALAMTADLLAVRLSGSERDRRGSGRQHGLLPDGPHHFAAKTRLLDHGLHEVIEDASGGPGDAASHLATERKQREVALQLLLRTRQPLVTSGEGGRRTEQFRVRKQQPVRDTSQQFVGTARPA